MKDEKTSRRERRRRRLRNQILAYLVMIIIVAMVLTAGYFGARIVIDYVNDYNEKVNRVIEEAESSVAEEQDSEPFIEEESESSSDELEGYKPPVEEDPLNTLIESLLSDMTTEEMIAGMFVVTQESITGVWTAVQAGDGTKAAVTENPVGGLVYAPKNFNTPEQFTEMITKTRSYSKYRIFTIVRAECGSTDFGLEAAAKVSELSDPENARQSYSAIASKIASYGIDMNLAPAVDEFLLGEAAGSDASMAAAFVNMAVQAMQEAKVSAVLQKFPGAEAGTKTLEELKNSEFAVYAAAIQGGVDCIMVSHIQVNSITGDDTPSSLSPVMVSDMLRSTLGFQGVVVTDYLDDSAITDRYSSAEAAVAAIQAGADLLLSPEDYQEAYEGVLQAVTDGTITQERIHDSIYRIYCVKYKNVIESL